MAAHFSYSLRPARAPEGARRPARALLAACGKYGPLEPPPDPNAPPKPANSNPRQHERPVQAVDPADRAAEAAVLPRFPAEISSPRECVPSPIATAFFTPRTSLWRRSRKLSATPFYCYSSTAIDASFEAFRRRVRRPEHAHFLRDEGQFQPGGADDAGQARRGHGRRQRGGTEAGVGRGRAGRAHHLFWRRQDAGRDEPRARRKNLLLQRRIGAGTGGAVARGLELAAPLRRSPSASIPTSMR